MSLLQYLAVGLIVTFAWWLTVRSVLRSGDEIKLPIIIMVWPIALAGLVIVWSGMGLSVLFNAAVPDD